MSSSHKKSVLLIAALVVTAGLATASTAAAPGPFGPDTCVSGFVWRESTPNDHVCVDPDTRFFVKKDNEQPTRFRSPTDRTYGPDTCMQGFVWREAIPEDHLCVAPGVREFHKKFNERAPTRWEATAPKDGSGWILGGVPKPFFHADLHYRIQSAFTGRGDLVVDAADRNVQFDANKPSQNFLFLRRGNGIAFQNAFQLMDLNTKNCLSVQGGSSDNGASLALESCGWRSNQIWWLQRRGDGKWEVRALHSNKCLDAANSALTAPPPGAHVQQWECIGGQNQAWNID